MDFGTGFILTTFVFIVVFLLFRIRDLNKQIAAKELDIRFESFERALNEEVKSLFNEIEVVRQNLWNEIAETRREMDSKRK